MIRNLKALGLLAFAALAMSAMFASVASAEGTKGFYAAGDGNTANFKTSTLVGHQYDEVGPPWNYFETAKGQVTCDEATFTSTIKNGTASELTVTPDYKKCQAKSGGTTAPATVTMNGCDYLFTQPTTYTGGGDNYTAKVGLTCPKENKIQIHVYLFGNSTAGTHSFNVCTIEVWPTGAVTGEGEAAHRFQEFGGESHVILDTTEEEVNKELVDDVTIAATVDEITYDDNCNGDEGGNGIYKNTVTATAWDDTDDAPNPTEHTEVREAWIEEEVE